MQTEIDDLFRVQIDDQILKEAGRQPRPFVAVCPYPQLKQLAERDHHLLQFDGFLLSFGRPRFPECNLPFTICSIPIELVCCDDGILIEVQ